jgi:hypothetical protein
LYKYLPQIQKDIAVSPNHYTKFKLEFLKTRNTLCDLYVLDCKKECWLNLLPLGLTPPSRRGHTFTYYKNLAVRKKFFIVTNLYRKTYQLKRLHCRATELSNKGWSMCGTFRSPFITNLYSMFKIPNRTTCPKCLDDFSP